MKHCCDHLFGSYLKKLSYVLPEHLVTLTPTTKPPSNLAAKQTLNLNIKGTLYWGTAIAQWIRLRLPSCGSNPKHTIYALKQSSFVLYICNCVEKRTKINKKRLGLAHF